MGVFELLRERVDIASLAGRFTQLKRAGKLQRGRCPLPDHYDSTPSFFVYSDGHCHCFGCGFHGDVVDLWAAVRGLKPGIEAALDLAREYGISLPEQDPEARLKAEARRRKEADFLQQARECHQALPNHPHVAEWWKGRGFGEELQAQFLLGAGGDGTSATIPFWHRGRIQGLIRRQLSGEPKYLLPAADKFPEGYKPLFIVGPHGGDVHLVEGFGDALSLAALDLRGIAVGGTGISERQKAELLKLKGDIYVFPDDDEAGAEAGRAWVRELYPRAMLCSSKYKGGQRDV